MCLQCLCVKRKRLNDLLLSVPVSSRNHQQKHRVDGATTALWVWNCRSRSRSSHVNSSTTQGSQEKNCCEFCVRQFLEPEAERHGNGKLTMRRIPLCSVFFIFLDWRFCFAKQTFWHAVNTREKERETD